MHISVPASTLAVILAIIIILGILLRLVNLRQRSRTKGTARTPRSPKSSRAPRVLTPRRNPFSFGSTPAKTSDHGLAVARKYGHKDRSPEWPRVAHEHLSIEPACVACGHKGRGLQVHHIKPFHLYPELELDPHNLITLCEIKGRDHHLLLGHLDNWESYNPNVHTDVKRFHNENALQIRSNPAWLKEEENRPVARA